MAFCHWHSSVCLQDFPNSGLESSTAFRKIENPLEHSYQEGRASDSIDQLGADIAIVGSEIDILSK